MSVETSRELAPLKPGVFDFYGHQVGPYSAAHRALLRSLTKGQPNIPYDLISWMMLYVMAMPRVELIKMAYDEALTAVEFTDAVMAWASTFPAIANVECLKITTDVLTDVRNVSVTATAEKKTSTESTSFSTPTEPIPGGSLPTSSKSEPPSA